MTLRTIFMPIAVVFLLLVSCSPADNPITTAELNPTLIFESSSEDENYSFTAARNMAMDSEGNLYVFDYMDNFIKKYDRSGQHVVTFGSQGEGEGQFAHLMDIRVFGDRLLALDSVGTLAFTLDGDFIEKTPFNEEVVCEFPQIREDGRFAGERYVPSALTKALTLRDPKGGELAQLAKYDLREFYPELEEGKDFFLQDYQAPFYLYSFQKNGSLLWAASNECTVYSHSVEDSSIASTTILSEEFTPLPIPADQVAEMEENAERIRGNPMLHMYVPRFYQIVQHLLAAPSGDIWVYVLSAEKTGFLVFSPEGKLKGHYSVNAGFEMTRARIHMFGNAIYFFVPGRNSVKIHASPF